MLMSKRISWFPVIGLCLGIMAVVVAGLPAAQAEELTGTVVMERTRAMESITDMQMEMEMRIINHRGQERVRSLTSSSLRIPDGPEYSLMRFTAPADVRGTGFLSVQHTDGTDESWIYLPALGRERRMASDERGGSFMGSDFTVEDISLNMDDYTFTLLEPADLDGTPVLMVEGIPAAETLAQDANVSRRLYFVCEERFVVLRGEVYDTAGDLERVLVSDSFEEVLPEVWIPKHSQMENVQKNTRTVLEYSQMDANTGLSEDDFSRRQLTRTR